MLQSRPSLLACSCAFVALVTASADASITVNTSVNTWNHGWATASDMTFADFNSDTLLTDAQASDVVAKFRIISLVSPVLSHVLPRTTTSRSPCNPLLLSRARARNRARTLCSSV